MKRILIIVDGHFGATLPLVKAFNEKKYKVDYVYVTGASALNGLEGIDIDKDLVMGVNKVQPDKTNTFFDYVNSNLTNFYVVRLPRPFGRIPILKDIISIVIDGIIKYLSFKVNMNNYELINIVGRYNSDNVYKIVKRLPKDKTFISLHEVCNHANKGNLNLMPKLIKYVEKNGCNIILHSQNSYNDWVQIYGPSKTELNIIHFGLFDSYKTIIPVHSILPDGLNDYVLFFGRIVPYKGLSRLYNAVVSTSVFSSVKFVVAGGGNDEVINKMKNDNRFVVINRYINNGELVSLIQKCRFVVCPYNSISQSGIVQTAFVFNKPVVATNLDAFREILDNNVTGELFDGDNYKTFIDAMLRMYDDNYYKNVVNNIRNFDNLKPKYSWKYIIEQYLNLKNSMLEKSYL